MIRQEDRGMRFGESDKKVNNPDYLFPSLFYQNITRAREKLCVIVSENIDVFEKLLHIKGNNYLEKRRDNIIC